LPELPEVETVARQLRSEIRDRTIERVSIVDNLLQFPARHTKTLRGARIREVSRFGKQVALEVHRPGEATHWLLVHLRMTGRLMWFAADGPAPGYRSQPRARLHLSGGELWFSDTRRFGTFTLTTNLQDHKKWQLDPILDKLTPRGLSLQLADSQQEIKAWLLRQDRLVGIGNIYASEILYNAGLHPQRTAASLEHEEIGRLCSAIRKVLQAAIRHCGTTFSDFQDSRGEVGGYQRFLKVYQRQSEACGRCGGEILRIVQQQRSTFFCADCQG
jgi:formamidopyrimidine-DNA glycosylase